MAQTDERMNVSEPEPERWASVVGGGALALYGLARGSRTGPLMAIAGGGLVYRGATGRCPLHQTLDVDTRHRHEEPRIDIVETSSEDSFPASDAPSWTPTTTVGQPPSARR